MAIQLLKPPSNIPGYGMSALMKDIVRTARSDVVTISTAMSTAISLFSVQANTLVSGAFAEITTTLNGGSSDVGLTLGDSDNSAALLTLEISSVMVSNSLGSLAKNYTAAQDIYCYFTPGEGVTGAVRFYINYRTDSDNQNVA